MRHAIPGVFAAALLFAGCDDDPPPAEECDPAEAMCECDGCVGDVGTVDGGGGGPMDGPAGDVPYDAFIRPDGPPECEVEGLEEMRTCGINDRGIERRVCAGQSWTEWSRCIDEDECADDVVDIEGCAGGERRRTCVTGHWSDWSECGAPPECEPGDTQLRACGRVGTGRESRACDNGRWGGWSACDDPSECDDGAEEMRPCGVEDNGTQPRRCVDGRWSEWGACDDPDRACEDGVTERVPCGLNRRGRAAHSCEGGRWGPFEACDDPDVCVDEAVQQEACGVNGRGLRRRSCAEGMWGEWGQCVDADACEDGDAEREACAQGGSRSRGCDEGLWGPWSECGEACEDGAEEARDCGINDNGSQSRECSGEQWSPWTACDDPDECRDGEREERMCGRGGEGRRERVCEGGQWSAFTPCEGADPCPDPENPECGEGHAERCNDFDDDHDGEVDEGLFGEAADPGGEAFTPFEQQVEDALDRASEWIRQAEGGTGSLTRGDARHNFLAVLALQGRRGRGRTGAPVGYSGLGGDDQALVRRMVRGLIDGEPSMRAPGGRPYVYVTGGNLVALGAYLDSGGPDEVGAAATVRSAMANGVGALLANQGAFEPNNQGGWNYDAPNASGDLSTTHYAIAGLVAAGEAVPEARDAVPRSVPFLDASRNDDGGYAYRPGQGSSSSMTAIGTWLQVVAGTPVEDPRVQDALAWLAEHRDEAVGQFRGQSTYLTMWYLAKALSVTVAGNDPRFAARDPAAEGHPEQAAGYYYDLAATLLPWQDANGAWGTRHEGSQAGWTQQSSHLFAMLALERATAGLGGHAVDLGERPQCDDGVDNDRDGLTDADDPQCVLRCVVSEGPVPACRNDRDDDGDGWIDLEDLGCAHRDDDGEEDPACANLRDDDGDGAVDWPADPGCARRSDADETDPEDAPACANGIDDDGDGAADFGDDADCLTADQDDEGSLIDCPGTDEIVHVGPWTHEGRLEGDNEYAGRCGGVRGAEDVFALVVDERLTLEVSTDHPGTRVDTALYVRTGCEGGRELACANDVDEENASSRLTVELERGVYYLFVDARIGRGPYQLSMRVLRRAPACSDGEDNDLDGVVDLADPGCADGFDASEADPDVAPACANGADDDGDRRVDWPADPGCAGPADDSEADPEVAAACANGVDDDGDGATDWPDDASCAGAGADSEFGASGACGNGRDDDGDGRVDFPFDPGCRFRADADEADPAEAPACSNGVDDDRDGVRDFPADRGCASAADGDEADPGGVIPACANGVDDDGDERVDFPDDPGCAYGADPDEDDGARVPACANGADDDGDGAVDFPADLGCYAAGDGDERGGRGPACGDGVDNDADGLRDLADPGCVDLGDRDERDPDESDCANGADDDGDGETDWPDDDGCRAAGDPTEDLACAADIEVVELAGGRAEGDTAGDDDYASTCGGQGAPDVVHRFVLRERADLIASVANAGTRFPAVVSVRRDCEAQDSEVACAGEGNDPPGTAIVRDAAPGEYFVIVDGGGQALTSRGEAIELEDPRGFAAQHDLRDNCGWNDGGNDAFDCYGRMWVTVDGGDPVPVSPREGQRDYESGGVRFRVRSDFPNQNVWRLRFDPIGDARPEVEVRLIGDVGSDGATFRADFGAAGPGGVRIPYLYTSDGGLDAPVQDPAIVHLWAPSDPTDVAVYGVDNDDVTITARVAFPLTVYTAASYAPHEAVAAALVSDLHFEGGDAASGRYELTVRAE